MKPVLWNGLFQLTEICFLNSMKPILRIEWKQCLNEWNRFWNEWNIVFEMNVICFMKRANFFFSIEWNRFFLNDWNELFETSDIKWVKLVLWNNLSLFLWHIPASWNKNIFIFKWVKLVFQIIETGISFNWTTQISCIKWVKCVVWFNEWNQLSEMFEINCRMSDIHHLEWA